MKFLTLLFLALTATLSLARDITIEWDLNPEPDILLYRLETSTNAAGPWTQAASTAIPAPGAVPTTINQLELKGIPNTVLFIRAFAMNVAGLESEPSEVLQVDPDRPGKPGKPRVKITLQSSTDLKKWENYHVVEKEVAEGGSQFFRTTLAMLPGAK